MYGKVEDMEKMEAKQIFEGRSQIVMYHWKPDGG
jgi:hypothetical protein